jgi:hypothetical protein
MANNAELMRYALRNLFIERRVSDFCSSNHDIRFLKILHENAIGCDCLSTLLEPKIGA